VLWTHVLKVFMRLQAVFECCVDSTALNTRWNGHLLPRVWTANCLHKHNHHYMDQPKKIAQFSPPPHLPRIRPKRQGAEIQATRSISKAWIERPLPTLTDRRMSTARAPIRNLGRASTEEVANERADEEVVT
jgi:hypothetical protein